MSDSCAMKTSGCKFRLRTSWEVPERLLPIMKRGRINNVKSFSRLSWFLPENSPFKAGEVRCVSTYFEEVAAGGGLQSHRRVECVGKVGGTQGRRHFSGGKHSAVLQQQNMRE